MLYSRSERPRPDIKVDSTHEHYQFVVDQLIGRHKRASIVGKLVKKGMGHDDAVFFVKAVFSKLIRTRRFERLTAGTVLLALGGGLGAALVAACLWGLTIVATGAASGAMTLGVGVACGFAVLGFSFKQQGLLLQFVAVLCTSAGVLLGKYGIYFFLRAGHGAVDLPMLFSSGVFAGFLSRLSSVFSLYDLVWIPLSLAAAVWLSTGWGVRLRAGDHVVGRADFLISNGTNTSMEESPDPDLPEGWSPREQHSQDE